MADINVKHRVTAKIGGKFYDLRPSANPHSKLPEAVQKFLKENDHLADAPVVVAASNPQSSELARMQAENDRLTGELDTSRGELKTTQADLTKAQTDLSAALAEIEKLTKK